MLKEMCAVNKFKVVMVWDLLLKDARCIARDGVHLSQRGKRLLCSEILSVIGVKPSHMGNDHQ